MYGYDDDDGDDFGLPSISNMKRKSRRKAAAQGNSSSQGNSASTDSAFGHSRRYSDSADIAIERPSSAYPMPKKSEGKILRPQYKDILKGRPTVASCGLLLLTLYSKTRQTLCI